MLIPGYLVAVATFPGVIVHEWGHALFCRLTKTKIHQICYFRVGTPSGYVLHEPPSTVWKNLLIGVAPFWVNTIMGFIVGLLAGLFLYRSHRLFYLGVIIAWVALSIAMHSFPSTGDAKTIWAAIWAKGAPILPRIVGTPLVGIIYIGAIGSVIWLDLAFGSTIALALPMVIMGS
jgi:hypothetical protein